MSIITNYLPLTILLSAGFGLAVHDTRIDKAIVDAMTMPAIIVEVRSQPERLISEFHTHSEMTSFASNLNLRAHQPSVQPKNTDDKKYIAQKGQKYSNAGSEYIWPSI
ncbi:MAG: hypothetical protein WA087_03870 [Candidatus Saccharimonadales bacterium]